MAVAGQTAPIACDDSRKGFRLTDPTFQLGPVELTLREVFAFSITRKLLLAGAPIPRRTLAKAG